jgi:hypothetical protein
LGRSESKDGELYRRRSYALWLHALPAPQQTTTYVRANKRQWDAGGVSHSPWAACLYLYLLQLRWSFTSVAGRFGANAGAAGRTHDEASRRKIIAFVRLSSVLGELRVVLHCGATPGILGVLAGRNADGPAVRSCALDLDDSRGHERIEVRCRKNCHGRCEHLAPPDAIVVNEADFERKPSVDRGSLSIRSLLEERATGETRFRFPGDLFRVA